MKPWGRRRFVKTLGGTVAATLTLEGIVSPAHAAHPCSYGSGAYGAGLYSGTLSTALPLVRASRSANDVALSWDPGPAGVTYEVWRSSEPFTPGDPGSSLIGVSTTSGLVDAGAIGSPDDLYYVVRGVVECD